MPQRSVILVAEDEEDYVLLLKQAFFRANFENVVYFVSTGQELMSYLKGKGKFAHRDEYPLPDLLLLDLKLPGYSGFEILGWIRSHPGLTALRVIVLTSSDRVKDVNDAYRLGANSFLVKPYDFEDLVNFAKLIKEFWLRRSECPETSRDTKPLPPIQTAEPHTKSETNPADDSR
ncbi:MAG TPA: response regulator [Verrucomicrobiae bacterium]|nr:response regulator [Verrucomicrobiae bacterium]